MCPWKNPSRRLNKNLSVCVCGKEFLKNMSKEANTVIIGAGVVGLAIAAELSRERKNIFVIEKNGRFGQETSSRNSEVIHSGIYYPPGSLKASLCVEGNRQLYEICERHRIPHNKCGKIIIATREDEVEQLYRIRKNAQKCGVDNLSFLSAKDIKAYEPTVTAVAGLYSPDTGIINAHQLMRLYFAQSQKNKVNFVFHAEVDQIKPASRQGYIIRVIYPDGQSDSLETSHLINCAGLESDMVAQMMGVDIDKHNFRLQYWKGDYFSLDSKFTFKHLVYPVPRPNNEGLGIHLTIDLSGRSKLGPDAAYLPERNIDYYVSEDKTDAFLRAVKCYLPFIERGHLKPDMAGIRPKLQKPGEAVRDFIIQEESTNGLPGVVNLIGIESPGLTSSPAIAKYVGNLLAGT